MVTGTWPPLKCGVGDNVRRLCDALARLGMKLEVITSTGAARTAPRGIRVHPIVRGWTVRAMGAVAGRIAAADCDLVHLQYPTVAYGKRLGINWLPVLLRRRLSRLPVVTQLHEFALFGRAGQWRLAPNILLARRVCVTSGVERDTVVRRYPSVRGRIRVIPIGTSIGVTGTAAAGRRLLRRFGVGPGEQSLVYFGWAGPGKGLPILLDAMGRLRGAKVPVRLVAVAALVPSRDALHARLAAQTRSLGIGDAVRWTGYLPARDVSSLLLAARACVLPFDDGLKLNRSSFIAPLEHGVPVVTTHGPGEREVAGAAVTFCDPDGASVARAVRAVLARPRPRRPVPPPAARRFGWDRIASAYVKVYREVAGGR